MNIGNKIFSFGFVKFCFKLIFFGEKAEPDRFWYMNTWIAWIWLENHWLFIIDEELFVKRILSGFEFKRTNSWFCSFKLKPWLKIISISFNMYLKILNPQTSFCYALQNFNIDVDISWEKIHSHADLNHWENW
jgi:hypothetical protein